MRIQATRFYASHRRAWTPRTWPLALADGLIIGAVAFRVNLTVISGIALGFGVAMVTANIRWWIWRKRHPIISVDEYITDLLRERRRNARWN